MSKQIEFNETARRRWSRRRQARRRGQGDAGPAWPARGAGQGVWRPVGHQRRRNVAREIDLDDPFENLGAQLVKSVATKTNDVAGDGTTTATVLAQAIIRDGLRNVAAGANPSRSVAVSARPRTRCPRRCWPATPVSGEQAIAQVATVSSRDEEIGDLVGQAMTKVGHDGVVTVEESSTLATELEFTEGVGFDKGSSRPTSSPTPTDGAVLDDALILLHRDKISLAAGPAAGAGNGRRGG